MYNETNNNVIAYQLLYEIYTTLIDGYNIPLQRKGSYRECLDYVITIYERRLGSDLVKMLSTTKQVRNKVCHFHTVTQKDLFLLKRAKSLLSEEGVK
ncbi:hypothetical protein JOD17_000108 [Geomicrobium sediminis]|uniref:DUF4145 domain-containing protein n=1 Tax=Geomicrobium sediminis TaxID=1347788 RepID=A0ABS2P6R5_9BACL|nr:hypothetical protein [Geomicrobium sediminis]